MIFPGALESRLVPRADAEDIGPSATAVLNAYLALQVIPSHIGLPILVVTFLLSKKVKRHPTMINLCITWILSGICSSMLLYAGQHTGPEPNGALCRAQTSLLYGVTPMWAVAILMLVYYIWACYDTRKTSPSPTTAWTMLVAPYLTLAIWSIAAAFLSVSHPENVSRNRRFFYCSLKYDSFSNAMSLFTAVICLVITVIEVHIAILLYRNSRAMRDAGKSAGLDVQLVIRVLVFGIYIFMGIFFSLATVWAPKSVIPDMFGATVGFSLMLLFGSQPDIWRTWFFWRSAQPRQVINLSREPSYMNQKIALDDDKTDVNHDSVMIIGKPKAAHIKTEFSHSVV